VFCSYSAVFVWAQHVGVDGHGEIDALKGEHGHAKEQKIVLGQQLHLGRLGRRVFEALEQHDTERESDGSETKGRDRSKGTNIANKAQQD
jgi:hypothetical protein